MIKISSDIPGKIKVVFPYNVSENSLQRAVKEAVRIAGIAKSVSVHTFRHCFATHLLEANYDISTVRLIFKKNQNCHFISIG